MTTASVNIPAGWYAVAGTNDVRWWDGRSFREVTLVDGVPRYRLPGVCRRATICSAP